MKKTVLVLLLLMVSACASPQYSNYGPTAPDSNRDASVNGSIYMGTRGTYGRVGVSTSNFGINIGV